MKNTLKKKLMLMSARIMALMVACSAAMLTAFADNSSGNGSAIDVDLEKVTEPVVGLINNILNVLIPVVAAAGAIFCVSLGVKYSRAEEPQEREKAKQHLKSAIIGFVLIFVLIVALRLSVEPLTNWMNSAS